MILTDSEREMLLKTLNDRKPEIVQARMAHALLLLADGLPAEDVAGLLYVTEPTVTGWQTLFSRHRPQRP
ncbi:helix-turn-helix domain-containing protein [Cereibacter sphaeroides]|uniref:helix-turn-helix domain-containing protein n=1 Tax=Cereibacter sphaeroides TaxID=1063 RepID=UPI001F429C35|nr:helix-turn-helix domain-containing protein [Cereibacter sphaeroides]MCE6967289.1 hypothetical protein [Cereibacter sphaeroides]